MPIFPNVFAFVQFIVPMMDTAPLAKPRFGATTIESVRRVLAADQAAIEVLGLIWGKVLPGWTSKFLPVREGRPVIHAEQSIRCRYPRRSSSRRILGG